jgi:hypothetical protein
LIIIDQDARSRYIVSQRTLSVMLRNFDRQTLKKLAFVTQPRSNIRGKTTIDQTGNEFSL